MITKHMPVDDLRTWLREQTRTQHQTLDSSSLLRALLQPNLNPGTYLSCLQHLHAAHAPTEAWLADLAHHAPTTLPAYESRLPALQGDIKHLAHHDQCTVLASKATACLNGTTTPQNAWLRDLAGSPPTHRGTAAYLGIRYVLEGATQGAKLIASRLQKHCPQVLEKSRMYWDHQARMMNHWTALLEHVGAERQNIDPDTLLRGADAAFGQFITVFNATAHGP